MTFTPGVAEIYRNGMLTGEAVGGVAVGIRLHYGETEMLLIDRDKALEIVRRASEDEIDDLQIISTKDPDIREIIGAESIAGRAYHVGKGKIVIIADNIGDYAKAIGTISEEGRHIYHRRENGLKDSEDYASFYGRQFERYYGRNFDSDTVAFVTERLRYTKEQLGSDYENLVLDKVRDSEIKYWNKLAESTLRNTCKNNSSCLYKLYGKAEVDGIDLMNSREVGKHTLLEVEGVIVGLIPISSKSQSLKILEHMVTKGYAALVYTQGRKNAGNTYKLTSEQYREFAINLAGEIESARYYNSSRIFQNELNNLRGFINKKEFTEEDVKKLNNKTVGYRIKEPKEIKERVEMLNKYKHYMYKNLYQKMTDVYSYPRTEKLKIKEMYPK